MAANLAQVSRYMHNRGFEHEVDSNLSCIKTGFTTKNVRSMPIVIHLTESGEFIHFIAFPPLEGVKNHPCKGLVFQSMLSIQYEIKMLRFEYDPRDGEIRASISFPLEDAQLTERQFHRVLHGLITILDEVALPRLKAVMQTGEDPGNSFNEAEVLAALKKMMPKAGLEQLQEMLKRELSGE